MMADWVDAGHAMKLTTSAAELLVVETGGGGVRIEVRPVGSVVLREPAVTLLDEGAGFSIDVGARIAEAVAR
jgi:hypothetical protein